MPAMTLVGRVTGEAASCNWICKRPRTVRTPGPGIRAEPRAPTCMSTTPGMRSAPRQHARAQSSRCTVALASLAEDERRPQHEARKSRSHSRRNDGTGASLEGDGYTKVSDAFGMGTADGSRHSSRVGRHKAPLTSACEKASSSARWSATPGCCDGERQHAQLAAPPAVEGTTHRICRMVCRGE